MPRSGTMARLLSGVGSAMLPYFSRLERIDRRLSKIERTLSEAATRSDDRGRLPGLILNDDAAGGFEIADLRDRTKRWRNIARIRRSAMAVAAGNGIVICRTLGKYKQYVGGNDIASPHLMFDGFWEYHVTEFIARNVTAGMTVMDLGANYGYYTLLLADLVGETGKVHAFEPNISVARMLEQSLIVNGYYYRVVVDRRVIWDRSNETVVFHIPEIAAMNARVVEPIDGRLVPSSPEPNTAIETIALDDLMLDRVSFIKADIEGAEERLWWGSKDFFRRNPDSVLLLEFNCTRCADPRDTLSDISNLFPLRRLDDDSHVKAVTIEEMLDSRHDWMLVLSRQDYID